MFDFLNSREIIITIIVMILFILIINYELKIYNQFDNMNKKIDINYAKLAADKIIDRLKRYNLSNDEFACVLSEVIDKFSTLNIITKNTGKGQELVLYLYLHIYTLGYNSKIPVLNMASITNEVIDAEEIAISIIYPNLIT